MKKLIVLFVLICLALLPLTAQNDYESIVPIFAGVEVGYGMGNIKDNSGTGSDVSALEVTPFIGTYVFQRMLAVEANVEIIPFVVFGDSSDDLVDISVISPQLLLLFTYTDLPYIQPYAAAGVSYNINQLAIKGEDAGNKVDMESSIGFVVKGGVKYLIPCTTFLLSAYGKYNYNSTKIKGEGSSIDVNWSLFSFGVGIGYLF